MKKAILLNVALLFSFICWAGNVKVLNTEYKGAEFDLNGPFVKVNVKLQASNVSEEECACFVLVKNEKWNSENMTISQLSKLCKTMCVGEAELVPVSGNKTLDVAVNIPLEQKFMTGKDTAFYMKSFVVDFNKKAIIAQGNMIRFNPNTQEAREQMYGKTAELAGGILGALFSGGGGGNIPEGSKKCSSCDGKGVVWLVGSDGTYDRQTNCSDCRGKGYVEKDFFDYGEERLHKSINEGAKQMKGAKNQKQQKKQQSQEEDDGMGGLLDLFGF